MKERLMKAIQGALKELGVSNAQVSMEHPEDFSHGDYSTNAALAVSKALKESPRSVAEKLISMLQKKPIKGIRKIEAAGPGFINFFLANDFFAESVGEIVDSRGGYGKNKSKRWKKSLFEYTNPNPFKVFHIGHLMANAIGESLSRIEEFQGAKVVRANYQGDVGLHVAKTIWGILQQGPMPEEESSLSIKTQFLGDAYVKGASSYEIDPGAKTEIDALNKTIFEKSNPNINEIYERGRKWSLEHFEEIYKILNTRFDHYFFESEVAKDGLKLVRKFQKKGVFEESEGAIVFKGEKVGLHTRVFINSKGLPTYEAKELGLNRKKFKKINPDSSIIVTANEQDDYFKVVLAVFAIIDPKIAERTKHISHGLLRFATGKMGSRMGNVITGESLIEDVRKMVFEKIKEREFSEEEKTDVATKVAVGAIKYSILRQTPGSDIIYDFEKSISFEGDSGPYLQYSYARARSILEKAKKEGIKPNAKKPSGEEVSVLEKMLYRFPEIVERAGKERAPNHIATYLIELSSIFNSYYAQNKIIDKNNPASSYRLALTEAFSIVLKNGLHLLGISALERM